MEPVSVSRLAKQMLLRRNSGDKPYLLFLGAGISVSAGISNMNQIIDRFLIDFGEVSDVDLNEMDMDSRFSMFAKKMANLSQNDRYYWLLEGFKDVKPSAGYRRLTRLIEHGFFDVIFTTNWDSLLDKSLNSSKKMITRRDFRFYVIGVHQNDFVIRSFQRFEKPPVKVLKLHGELESRIVDVVPNEISEFSPEIIDFLRNFFKTRDQLMIGYSAADMDVQSCIENNSSTLIYVNPKPPSTPSTLAFVDKFRYTQIIDGREGEFEVFMRKLSKALFSKSSLL